MLSPRAAAFSVQALLTAQENAKEGQLPSSGEDKNNGVTAQEVCEESRNSLAEGEEEAVTPGSSRDETKQNESPPPEPRESASDKETSSGGEAGDTDEEDLLVDVEDCSMPVSSQTCSSPVSERCRTPLHSPPSSHMCVLPSQHLTRNPSPAQPSGAAEWQMLTRIPNMSWMGQEGTESRCEDVSVQLLQKELWAKFHNLTTEMIITKNGRRMFPVVKVRLRGLDPEKTYAVFLDMVAVDTRRYRYVYPSSRWMVAGTGELLTDQTPYIHPDSPATGVQWMATPAIAFDRLKLTNNKTRDAQGQIVLHSMQKYVPRVWVQEVAPGISWSDLPRLLNTSIAFCASFPETSFITVTAYQNQQITRLKIESNPFAKGFRDTSKQKEFEQHGATVPGPGGGISEATNPRPSPLPLPLNPSSPQQFHIGPSFPGLPRPFTFPGALSPPLSPMFLPPTHWLNALKTGDPPWLATPSSPILQSPQSPLPFLLPSILPSLHSQFPTALDLSKPKDDT